MIKGTEKSHLHENVKETGIIWHGKEQSMSDSLLFWNIRKLYYWRQYPIFSDSGIEEIHMELDKENFVWQEGLSDTQLHYRIKDWELFSVQQIFLTHKQL